MMGSGRPTYTVAARPILRIVDSLDMPAVLDMRLLFGSGYRCSFLRILWCPLHSRSTSTSCRLQVTFDVVNDILISI